MNAGQQTALASRHAALIVTETYSAISAFEIQIDDDMPSSWPCSFIERVSPMSSCHDPECMNAAWMCNAKSSRAGQAFRKVKLKQRVHLLHACVVRRWLTAADASSSDSGKGDKAHSTL